MQAPCLKLNSVPILWNNLASQGGDKSIKNLVSYDMYNQFWGEGGDLHVIVYVESWFNFVSNSFDMGFLSLSSSFLKSYSHSKQSRS